MEIIDIKSPDGKLVLEVAPAIGGCVTRFDYSSPSGKKEIFRGYDSSKEISPLNFGSFPLTPFSNRIGNCQMRFENREYSVGPAFGGEAHPNHGDGWFSEWQVTEKNPHKIAMGLSKTDNPHSPYRYEAAQVFELKNGELLSEISVRNIGKEALPFGTGHHPYFARNDETILKLNLTSVWNSRNMLPTEMVALPAKWDFSKGLALSNANLQPAAHGADGSAYIDHCFAGWDQRAEIVWPDKKVRMEITADTVFKHFVIYIPSGENFFCAEPVTNATDGFNLMAKGIKGTGTVILQPGETLSGKVSYHVFDM